MVTDMMTALPAEIVEEDAQYPAQYAGGAQQTGSAMTAIMQIAPMAMQRPRSESQALKKVLAAADDTWYWAIPNRGEGLSVRGARSAVRHYRNVGIVPYIEEVALNSDRGTKPGWRMTVLAIDMENIVIETSSATCSKPERKPAEKDLAYEQRCFQQQLAFLGRIERNAIFKILPGEWQEQIKGAIFAKRKLDPLPKRINELVARAQSLGITADQIKQVIGCAPLQMSEAQWADLWGRTNAIKNEGFSIADAFPELGLGEKGKPDPNILSLSEFYREVEAAGGRREEAEDIYADKFGEKITSGVTRERADAVMADLRLELEKAGDLFDKGAKAGKAVEA